MTATSETDGSAAHARIVRNISTLGLGQIFTWISSAGLVGILPRFLGDESLGKFTTAVSLTDLCGLIASLGITEYLVKEVARQGDGARSAVLNALAMRLPLVLAAGGLSVLTTVLLGHDAATQHVVFLLTLNIALSAIGGVLSGVLQGMQDMRSVALAGALSKAALLALVWLFLAVYHLDILGVALAWNVAGVVNVATLLFVLLRRRALAASLDVRTWRVILLGSLPFAVWQSALMVYGQIGVVILSALTHDAVVGWHGAAVRIIGIPVFVPVIIASAVFPALSRSARHDEAEFRMIARRSLEAVLILTVPMGFGIMAIAAPLLALLGYRPEFEHSIPSIVILAAHIPLVGIGMIIGNALSALDRQRSWAMTGIAAAVLNPSLNLLLIPLTHQAFGNGAIGVAVATLLTEFFMLGMGLWLLRGAAFGLGSAFFGLRCLTAGLVMTGVIWLIPPTSFLPVTVAIGAAVYLVLSFALGTVSVRDLRQLCSYVQHRQASQAGVPA